MRVRLKGINSNTKRLANGELKTYYYAWKGGPALPGKPGDPEFMTAFQTAHSAKISPTGRTVSTLIAEYKQMPEFTKKIAEVTRQDYERHLRRAEAAFGDMPIEALSDPRTRTILYDWRDEIARNSLRGADYAWMVLGRVFSLSRRRGKIAVNPCEKGGRLFSGTRADIIWTEEQEEQFMRCAPPHLRIAMVLALWTGQRESDLILLPWVAYDGERLTLTQRKTKKPMPIPVGRPLKHVLDRLEPLPGPILRDAQGKPWGKTRRFSRHWHEAQRAAGIEGVFFKDLRGTAVTRLAIAGCTEPEISSITGHSIATVRSILEKHYLARDPRIAQNAIRKLEKLYDEVVSRQDVRGTVRLLPPPKYTSI